jgi:hypothetical protein
MEATFKPRIDTNRHEELILIDLSVRLLWDSSLMVEICFATALGQKGSSRGCEI